jgi:6-phosphogluconate dehydrogenase
MIGCGSMGGGISLLSAEHGLEVSLSDPSEEAMEKIFKRAEDEGISGKLQKSKGNTR